MRLTDNRTLRWCEAHEDVAYVYEDGSHQCFYALIVKSSFANDECRLVPMGKRPIPTPAAEPEDKT